MMITGEQIRAARAFARLEQAEFARMAGISLETVKRLERFRGIVEANSRTLKAISDTFQGIGVDFLSDQDTVSIRMNVRHRSEVSAAAQAPGGRDTQPQQPLFRLIFYSTASASSAAAFDDTVGEILQIARPRNQALGVGSALLASEGRFLQVIEGLKEPVFQVFGEISLDERHTAIHPLQTRGVDFRLFGEPGITGGAFARGDEIFSDEPAMSGGFRPESLSPAAALTLLGAVDRYARRAKAA